MKHVSNNLYQLVVVHKMGVFVSQASKTQHVYTPILISMLHACCKLINRNKKSEIICPKSYYLLIVESSIMRLLL